MPLEKVWVDRWVFAVCEGGCTSPSDHYHFYVRGRGKKEYGRSALKYYTKIHALEDLSCGLEKREVPRRRERQLLRQIYRSDLPMKWIPKPEEMPTII